MASHITDHMIIWFMILQLFSFLDMNSNKCVSIWNHTFNKKKFLKLGEKLRKKAYMSNSKKIS